RAVVWLQRILCLNLAIVTGILLFTNNVYLYRLETVVVFGVVYLLSFAVAIYLLIAKKRNTLLVYFVLALLSLMMSGFVAVLFYFFVSDEVNIGTFVEVGAVLEIIFFSLGLGYRMKAREREKRELELQNAKLLKEQNAILEKRVEERTRELSISKEEIQTQNEELRQQQEEVLAQRSYIEEQNNTLRERETRINDSLRYAQTIQEAILSVEETLERASSDYFVMYRPKDIVSGDFYWVEEEGKYHYWAVADCTGHGVPGAFMSMMGATLLNDTVHEIQGAEPAQVLEELDERLRHALSQRTSNNKDGMDIVLCRLEKKPNDEVEIIFSGAKRPLYYFNPLESSKGIQKVRGTRRSIGGRLKKERSFEQTKLTLPMGTILYFFSDGYADQHSEEGKKIGSVQFHSLLEEVVERPLAEQATRVETYFDDHKKGQVQRDDVTVLGIQI
ncbi:MAG: SpoIIE family protein phosphatase, partial [Bacteroidota bacterium]